MRIGIDMLAVQEADRAGHESGRFGRHLVGSILARADGHQIILYAHEGLPLAPVPPSGRGVVRRVLAPVPTLGPSRRRPTTQRLLDQDPDRLDWLVLLDPISPHYGGVPPTPPLVGPRVASVVVGPVPGGPGEGAALALRRHDALLAVTGAVARDLRRDLGRASGRVACLSPAAGPGFDPGDPGEPLSTTTAAHLGRLGINGPYLLHVATPGRLDDVAAWARLFGRLPVEVRHRHRLVVLGLDPAGTHVPDAPGGLIAIPEADEATIQLLTRRCSAWLGGLRAEGAGLRLVEALRSGVPVVAARTPGAAEVVGDAGLLVDPADPDAAADDLARLLSDHPYRADLAARAAGRGASFGWEAPASTALAALEAVSAAATAAATPGAGPVATRTRLRHDAEPAARPRIAYFPSLGKAHGRADRHDPLAADGTPALLLGRYQVDCYEAPDAESAAAPLPIDLGRFDLRLFGRNDALLDYHAAVYRVATPDDAARLGPRLARRAGLVLLEADAILGPLAARDRPEAPAAAEALGFCRSLLRTGSRLMVRSPSHFEALIDRLDPAPGAVLLAPRDRAAEAPGRATRGRARARLDLWDETVVVGQFPGSGEVPVGPEALAGVLRAAPNVVLITFGPVADPGMERLALASRRLGLGDRFLVVPPVAPERAAEVASLLDLAIVRPGGESALGPADLFRARVATLVLGDDPGGPMSGPGGPDGRPLARLVRDLALDPAARAALARAGHEHEVGVVDPDAAREILIEAVERCAAELPRASGRTPAAPGGPARRMVPSPHLTRPESRRGDGVGPRSR